MHRRLSLLLVLSSSSSSSGIVGREVELNNRKKIISSFYLLKAFISAIFLIFHQGLPFFSCEAFQALRKSLGADGSGGKKDKRNSSGAAFSRPPTSRPVFSPSFVIFINLLCALFDA
jgi:hypothetical protein